ncbi:MAG TPA: redoxin domain-containing protein [Pirellulales bacterium]|nr:redoxin domain-containing protein [Pirellulales bacterium]
MANSWKRFVGVFAVCVLSLAATAAEKPQEPAADKKADEPKLAVGDQAPDFVIKDADGKDIKLADLAAKGPVLVRLTCGCSGCDKELAYFQQLHSAYEGKGLTSLAVFKEPDSKVADYVKQKKLNMLYAVDTKGESWNVFQTKSMPTNFLIEKGGRIVSIAAGCDPSGLLANKLSDKVAELTGSQTVDVQKEVATAKAK